MPIGSLLKVCRRCSEEKSKSEFVDVSGKPNPRGGYCHDCHLDRVNEWKEENKEEKKSKLRKLRILYGKWWPYYCLPLEFSSDIYAERDFCPYCGGTLPPEYIGSNAQLGNFRGRAHLDHMDPLELGGEDSIRNVIYVCDSCNYRKGKTLFLDWLKIIPEDQVNLCRKIYLEKHGHRPESFVVCEPTPRCNGVYGELLFSEESLQRMYPKPLVSGPPKPWHNFGEATAVINNDGNLVFRFMFDELGG